MSVNKTTIATSFAAGIATGLAIGCNLDICLRTLKAIDTRIVNCLGSYRWVAYTGTLSIAIGVAYYFRKEEFNPLARAVADGTMTFRDAFDQAKDKKDIKTAEILVRQAIERGDFDVNAKGEDGTTPLIWAAQYGLVDLVNMLLKKGANANAADEHGDTALMDASFFGHAEIVSLLLKQEGININAKNKSGWTALRQAQHEGWNEIVKMLKNADKTAKK